MGMEIWKDIKGYKGRYQVSDKGRVKSFINRFGLRKKPKILKPNTIRFGYKQVSLHKKGTSKALYVHRLVADSFIKNKKNKPQVNHKNSNTSDNNVNNLEWVTPSENMLHGFKYGNKSCIGENNPVAKLNEKQVRVIKHILSISSHINMSRIGRIFKVSRYVIWKIKQNRIWKYV